MSVGYVPHVSSHYDITLLGQYMETDIHDSINIFMRQSLHQNLCNLSQVFFSVIYIIPHFLDIINDCSYYYTVLQVTCNNPEKLLCYNAAVCKLPIELLNQFRTVSIVKPDLKLTLEALLISQGFHEARQLAHKTIILFDMSRQLIGTNTPIGDSTEHLSKTVYKYFPSFFTIS